jgi:hypothetical protein
MTKPLKEQMEDSRKEVIAVANALTRTEPTTTKEGIRQYRQIERAVNGKAKDLTFYMKWEQFKKNAKEWLNKEMGT